MANQTEGTPRRRRRKTAPLPTDDGSDDAKAIVDAPTPTPRRRLRPAADKAVREAKPGNPAGSSDQLKKEAEVADQELFATAPHQGKFPKAPDMQRGFQTIVTDLFDSGYNVREEWEAIRAGIEIKDALTPQRLKTAANEQEKLADRAHQLYIVAKVEVSAYMRETESVYGALRDSAIQGLEMQKANKSRTKQITDADVKAEAARMYPDEWADICTRRERAEAMLSQLANLSALAKSRCYTVSNMMAPGNRSV